MADEALIKLLEEIRDLQKAHIASYKEAVKNQEESIDLQKRAVKRQRIFVAMLGIFFVGLLIWLFFFSSKG
jgi:hypothetical protein